MRTFGAQPVGLSLQGVGKPCQPKRQVVVLRSRGKCPQPYGSSVGGRENAGCPHMRRMPERVLKKAVSPADRTLVGRGATSKEVGEILMPLPGPSRVASRVSSDCTRGGLAIEFMWYCRNGHLVSCWAVAGNAARRAEHVGLV